ncbi:alkylation response protein AidB-like acyl-CoA dehydrogenase [Williamsia limnetica]|uniref:Alkylation response protein AidB-like acyl-CoA dehydrogenase n=1 Tax=Williamsia limnetica TaxID=882452 RepID=A0A318RLE5_WILLI|nr:acyl-CoA dehydrogenase family protein [Williamsia limnetica]PYE11935.1 alkylation response protein AidB-like acyl-CoA dehydrogenase [Williamsia limnetica]
MTTTGVEFADLHNELTAVARELLAAAPRDENVDWALITRSGWTGLEVPETLGGAGATFAEVAVILREIGRAVARGPYPAVAGIAVGALGLLEPSARRDHLLAATASGDKAPVVAMSGESLLPNSFRIVESTLGLKLTGSIDFVLDAPGADRLLIPAVGQDGFAIIVDVDTRTPGLRVDEQPVVDATRSFGRVAVGDVLVSPDSVLRFHPDPEHSLQRLYDRAGVSVALDSLGLSEAMLDATVAYVGTREQFGRRIGSFQAVKHACADMLVQITIARTLVAAAVEALCHPDTESGVAASMAKAFTTVMAVEVAGKAMQLHGGMGYTWEGGIHVHLKRAILNRSLFGSPAAHRRRIAERY